MIVKDFFRFTFVWMILTVIEDGVVGMILTDRPHLQI